jgi:hypothetical protein
MTNSIAVVRYRARQFFAALAPRVSAEDWRQIETIFEPESPPLRLFQRMRPSDQQHAVAVLNTLQEQGQIHPALRQAALLHDVGKAMGQPLFYRVLIVLLKRFWPAGLQRLSAGSLAGPAWRRPFVVHAQHPAIGARWAAAAGCDDLVVALIRCHQSVPAQPADTLLAKLHQALFAADNQN